MFFLFLELKLNYWIVFFMPSSVAFTCGEPQSEVKIILGSVSLCFCKFEHVVLIHLHTSVLDGDWVTLLFISLHHLPLLPKITIQKLDNWC